MGGFCGLGFQCWSVLSPLIIEFRFMAVAFPANIKLNACHLVYGFSVMFAKGAHGNDTKGLPDSIFVDAAAVVSFIGFVNAPDVVQLKQPEHHAVELFLIGEQLGLVRYC